MDTITTTRKTATPAKLRDGSWGARVQGACAPGQEIQITTKAGKSWTAIASKVIWSGDGATLVTTVSAPRNEPKSVDGDTAIIGQHWSSRGNGPLERLCASGCGRRVGKRYAECYSCHQESMDAM